MLGQGVGSRYWLLEFGKGCILLHLAFGFVSGSGMSGSTAWIA